MAFEKFADWTKTIREDCTIPVANRAGNGTTADAWQLASLFVNWLYEQDCQPERIRFAPSVIARSELDLFGVSTPRFAIRVRLENSGFVNIRRLRRLLDAVEQQTAWRDVPDQVLEGLNRTAGYWIADSLLRPPRECFDRRFPGEQFEFLTARLAVEYGEAGRDDQPQPAWTPFVAFLPIGGGLCAQASCFMALCLSKDVATIYSIAEISHLAGSDDERFEIGGMSMFQIRSFFQTNPGLRNVRTDGFKRGGLRVPWGLTAQLQQVTSLVEEIGNDQAMLALLLKVAVRAYCLNGIPIIAHVALDRLTGADQGKGPWNTNPVISLNGTEIDRDNRRKLPFGIRSAVHKETDTDNHCVVIIGCSQNRLIFNDPATFPFLEATYDEFLACRATRIVKSGTSRARLSCEEADGLELVTPTPEGVGAALLSRVVGDSSCIRKPGLATRVEMPKASCQGVIDRAIGFQDIGTKSPLQFKAGIRPGYPGEFYLMQVFAQPDSDIRRVEPRREPLPFEHRDRAGVAMLAGLSEGWYWLQHVGEPNSKPGGEPESVESLWFWNAGHDTLPGHPARVFYRSAHEGPWLSMPLPTSGIRG